MEGGARPHAAAQCQLLHFRDGDESISNQRQMSWNRQNIHSSEAVW